MKPFPVYVALFLGGIFLSGSSCAWLRDYRIDPSGNCLFVRQQSGVVPNTTGESAQPPSVSNPSATTPTPGATPDPTVSTPQTTQPTPYGQERFPGGFGAVVPGTGLGGGFSGASPLSEHYASSSYPDTVKGPALVLSPKVHFAPINSEIVVVASFLGKDEYLRTNQLVEWSLDGVGHILTYDTGSWCDWFHLDFESAKKTSDRSVKTKTSSTLWTIDRGTVDTKDDVEILKGQTWITLKSSKEGTSSISAFSPAIDDWSKRSATSTIHWIDAQFAFPRPSIAPVGETRQLTTIVSRQSNGGPRPGWFVEYEIIGGPAAGFGEGFAQRTKVETDSGGQAPVQLTQKEMTAGTSTIAVRILRPASPESNEGELVVGNQLIRQIWTTGGVLSVKVHAPRSGVEKQELPYRITVSNASSRPTAASLRVILPQGMEYVRSTPVLSAQRMSVLEWELDNLPPQGSIEIDLTTISKRSGNMNVQAEVRPRSADAQSSSSTGTGTGAGTGISPTPYPEGTTTPSPTTPDRSGYGQRKEKIKVRFYRATSYSKGEQTDFPPDTRPSFPVGEKRWFIINVENVSGEDLRNVYMVLYPPEEIVGGRLRSSTMLEKTAYLGELFNDPKYPQLMIKKTRISAQKPSGGSIANMHGVEFEAMRRGQFQINAEVLLGKERVWSGKLEATVE